MRVVPAFCPLPGYRQSRRVSHRNFDGNDATCNQRLGQRYDLFGAFGPDDGNDTGIG